MLSSYFPRLGVTSRTSERTPLRIFHHPTPNTQHPSKQEAKRDENGKRRAEAFFGFRLSFLFFCFVFLQLRLLYAYVCPLFSSPRYAFSSNTLSIYITAAVQLIPI